MNDLLNNNFIAQNLEEIIDYFDYVDIEDIEDLTEFLLTIWVLLGLEEQSSIDSDNNLIPGSTLFCLNDEIYDTLLQDNKANFLNIIRNQLLISEKYEVLSLMPSLLE